MCLEGETVGVDVKDEPCRVSALARGFGTASAMSPACWFCICDVSPLSKDG
jgi:hypothetical protein